VTSIVQLSVKSRVRGEVGLPKRAVPQLRVTVDGAEGDYNHYRASQLAGDLDQALLVVTLDLLSTLAAEGWPVRPGDLGENLTLAGVAEDTLGPGVQLRVGEVTLVITKPCDPCTELYTLPYIGDERGPAFLKATAGRRGWYAKVLVPGEITTHSVVSLTPTAAVT
jgi:MOSC domain-containing protein YiiM